MTGTPARRGAGGPVGGIVAVERDRGWPLVAGMPACLELRGAVGMRLDSTDAWPESARAGWPGRPHARGAGGSAGGIVAVERFTYFRLCGCLKDAIDIYDHIDLKEMKEANRGCFSQFGI